MASVLELEEIRFLKGFFESPFRVASPLPSGRKLARTVAAQIDRMRLEPVLELGPGTGAVTQAIVERGIPESHVYAIERDSNFAAHLRTRFSRMHVLEGDAFAFEEVLLRDGYDGLFSAVVCGVPVLGETAETRRQLLEDGLNRLAPGCPFVQFSYSRKPPIDPGDIATVERAAKVWSNIPPLQVWVYRAKG
jgi:phosphatidylethanolamine/phosphatidyl-N-methylethanolamine N-methyltransferase